MPMILAGFVFLALFTCGHYPERGSGVTVSTDQDIAPHLTRIILYRAAMR
jgi:hypothetical protein